MIAPLKKAVIARRGSCPDVAIPRVCNVGCSKEYLYSNWLGIASGKNPRNDRAFFERLPKEGQIMVR